MSYYLYQKNRYGTYSMLPLKAQNINDATKEALVINICEYWMFMKPEIDFNDFDAWLIKWLKSEHRYWNLRDIFENIDKEKSCQENLMDSVFHCLNLSNADWKNVVIFEVKESHTDKGKEAYEMGKQIVSKVILEEYLKAKEEKDMVEYKRLREKYGELQ